MGPERVRLHIEGVVQGVGFRPFVHALATRFGLVGFVANDTDGVVIEVEGSASDVSSFADALRCDAPSPARIETIRSEPLPPVGEGSFAIAASGAGATRHATVPPDTATCDDCVRELRDSDDRRYRYPFVNCARCGPRFTIVRDIPIDRANTTMAAFELCPACRREYEDPSDRRFHAQAVCCPACGPHLRAVDRAGRELDGDPIATVAALLGEGQVVAIKGLGGYHLAATASNEQACRTLRARKHREEKPFAVLVSDLVAARRAGRVDRAAEALLTDPARPIVLVPRSSHADLADAVAPWNRSVGLMLPYTPLHHLLCNEHPAPLVLTSGNRSDEPIAYRDEDAFERLGGIADAFLTHDRAIHVRVDDSVVRPVGDRRIPIRRSRGYAPSPLKLPSAVPHPVLGCGAELKHTFCLARDHHAFISHHVGDLENWETYRAFVEGVDHFRRIFEVHPEVVAHDLHPEYLSTKYALELPDVDLVGVQHHHAHIAACLVDNGVEGPVIGVAFDGLGYGTDGGLWGGEILVADLARFERAGHLESVPLPGGAAAIREPWRMAAAYLDRVFSDRMPEGLGVVARNRHRWEAVLQAAHAGLNAPPTTSMGRLFDAVSALLDVRDEVSYEGQAAIELEQRADPDERGHYDAALEAGAPIVMRGSDLLAAAVEDVLQGTPVPTVSSRFHNGVVRLVANGCELIRDRAGLGVVALSGGVFQNALLVERLVSALRAADFEVLTHIRVPPNDGGISLGQVAVAGARSRAG